MLAQLDLAETEKVRAAQAIVAKISCLPLSAAVWQQAVTDNLRSSTAGWRAWVEVGSREDISTRMSRVLVPVSLLAGEADTTIDPAVQQEMVRPFLPQATLTNVPGAGHLLAQEVPAIVAETIRLLWAKLSW